MVFFVFSVFGFSQATFTLESNQEVVVPGSDFVFSVNLDASLDQVGFSSGEIKINFDQNAFDCKTVTPNLYFSFPISSSCDLGLITFTQANLDGSLIKRNALIGNVVLTSRVDFSGASMISFNDLTALGQGAQTIQEDFIFNNLDVIIGQAQPADTDGDGLLNEDDNCPDRPNPDQANADGDDEGDVCDLDWDNDGLFNVVQDNCPLIANPNQEDVDSDGVGDACDDVDDRVDAGAGGAEQGDEVVDPEPIVDSDQDSIPDGVDNCPNMFNNFQEDTDGDGIGDACEEVVLTKSDQLVNRLRFLFNSEEGIVQKAKVAGAVYCYYQDDCEFVENELDSDSTTDSPAFIGMLGSLGGALEDGNFLGVVGAIKSYYQNE